MYVCAACDGSLSSTLSCVCGVTMCDTVITDDSVLFASSLCLCMSSCRRVCTRPYCTACLCESSCGSYSYRDDDAWERNAGGQEHAPAQDHASAAASPHIQSCNSSGPVAIVAAPILHGRLAVRTAAVKLVPCGARPRRQVRRIRHIFTVIFQLYFFFPGAERENAGAATHGSSTGSTCRAAHNADRTSAAVHSVRPLNRHCH